MADFWRVSELPLPDPNSYPVPADHSRMPGQMQLALLRHAGLTDGSTLVEIGCGVGRLVYELAVVKRGGRYIGFDIAERSIAWLNRNYAPSLPGFEFHAVEAANQRYRPKGKRSPREVRFPVGDAQCDLLFAFSVFTHMRLADVCHYIAETSRVLAPDGRAVLTFFAIPDGDISPMLGKHGRFVPIGNASWAVDPRLPERAIAFDESVIYRAFEAAGLTVAEVRPGYWRDPSLKQTLNPPFHKDVIVATRTG